MMIGSSGVKKWLFEGMMLSLMASMVVFTTTQAEFGKFWVAWWICLLVSRVVFLWVLAASPGSGKPGFRLVRLVKQGEMMPPGFGAVYLRMNMDAVVCMPVPLNVVVAAGRSIWLFLKYGWRPMPISPRSAYRQGRVDAILPFLDGFKLVERDDGTGQKVVEIHRRGFIINRYIELWETREGAQERVVELAARDLAKAYMKRESYDFWK